MNRMPKWTAILSAAAVFVLLAGCIVLSVITVGSRRNNDPLQTQATPLNRLDSAQNGVSMLLHVSTDNDAYFAANRFPTLSGAVGDGRKDVTSILQTELDAAGESGGTVYLPQGTYLISASLRIPAGVTLRGDFNSPESKQHFYAKTVLAYSGKPRDDDAALICLEDGAALIGITVYYEDQSPSEQLAYAPAVLCTGDALLQDLILINPFCGIEADGGTTLTLRRIWMSPLRSGIRMANSRGTVTMEDVFISPTFWLNAYPETFTEGQYGEMSRYQRENLQAIVLEAVEDATLCRLRLEGAHEGLSVNVPAEKTGTLRIKEASVSTTVVPLFISSLPASGILISDSSFSPDSDAGADCIRIGSGADAPILFSACAFTGLPKTVIRAENPALLSFYHCSFGTWWNTCFDVAANTFLAVAPSFRSEERLARLGKNGLGVLYDSPALEDSEQLLFSVPETAAVTTESVPVLSQKETTRERGQETVLNAWDFGVSAEAQDNAAALQRAFDAFDGARGVLFLPEGSYRFTSPVTVPEGVRLIGVGDRGATYRTTLSFSLSAAATPITLGENASAEQLRIVSEASAASNGAYALTASGNGIRVIDVTVDAPRGIFLNKTVSAALERLTLNVTREGVLLADSEQTLVTDAAVIFPSADGGTGIRLQGGSATLCLIRADKAGTGLEFTDGETVLAVQGTLLLLRDTVTALHGDSAGSVQLSDTALRGGSGDAAIVTEGTGALTVQGALFAGTGHITVLSAQNGLTELRAAVFADKSSVTVSAAAGAVARVIGSIWDHEPETHAAAAGKSRVTLVANILRSDAEFEGIDADYLQRWIADGGTVENKTNVIRYRYVDPEVLSEPEPNREIPMTE